MKMNMTAKEMIEELQKMKPNDVVRIYDYTDGRYYSNMKVDASDRCINFYKGI